MENAKKSKGSMKMNAQTEDPKLFLYFISNYFWLIIFVSLYFYFKFNINYQDAPNIKSINKTENWNSLYNPHIFGFISDAHVTSFLPKAINNTNLVLETLYETGVEKILVAGDISDNFASKGYIKHGHQNEEDYILFKQISDKYPSDLFIIASGNHDEFGVESYNSPDHFIIKYTDFYSKNDKYKDYDNFLISTVNYEDVDFFVMNPYRYPTVCAGLGHSSNLTRKMLDKIEKILSKRSESKIRILLTHYPISFSNTWARSTSKKNLIDITTSANLTAILSGHSHRELILHRKSSIEIRPCSIRDGQKSGGGYSYISIDNGGFSSHGYNIKSDKPLAVLTYPIEKKYVSDQTDFSYKKFDQSEIRVVHFSEDSNFNVSVSCKSSSDNFKEERFGHLKYQRIIRRNQTLYSTSLSQLCKRESDFRNDTIEYCLTFSGDWIYEAHFVAGNSTKLEKEMLDTCPDMKKFIMISGFICWLIILFIWFPFGSLKYFDKVSLFIAGRNILNISNKFDLIFQFLFGFCVIKSRIFHNVNKSIRLFYLFLSLSPFYLPISLMKIGNNTYGFICFCGFYLNGFAFDLWGFQLTCYFVLFVLLPSTFVFSAISFLGQTRKFNFFFVFDILVALSQFVLLGVALFMALYQSTTILFVLTSPIFVFVPMIIFSMEIISFVNLLKSICESIHNRNDNALSKEVFVFEYCQ